MFKKNESLYDRLIRILVAAVLVYLAYFKTTGTIQIILYILALASFITGILGYCHLYSLLKFSTLKEGKNKSIESDKQK